MYPLRPYILSFLFLISFISHRSFAIDDNQNCDANILTVQEYCQCLVAMASAEDIHGLYDPEAMSGEIIRGISHEDQQPHFLYGIAHGVDPHSPMLGLTELDAIRCCNWMETSLPGSDSIVANTETGSYLLHDDGTFETNDKAQLSLIPHDDGTFEIVSKVVKGSTSPLMFEKSKFDNSGSRRDPRRFPEISTAATRGDYGSIAGQDNRMGSSLSEIVHANNDAHDHSLIGYTYDDTCENVSYSAIEDINFCGLPLPAFVKACLINEEKRQQLEMAHKNIKSELESAMKSSSYFKEKASFGFSRLTMPAGKIDNAKLASALKKFDQSFNPYNLTRARLKAFCNQHQITVSEGLVPPVARQRSGSWSVYGSVETYNKSLNTLQPTYNGDDLEYEEKD
ncbi:MAG: hypothetical protein FJ390_03870 [Verrucomicrobia bacterium]|nr:hypothetical protein [Verrucomicrobiota bacterium]